MRPTCRCEGCRARRVIGEIGELPLLVLFNLVTISEYERDARYGIERPDKAANAKRHREIVLDIIDRVRGNKPRLAPGDGRLVLEGVVGLCAEMLELQLQHAAVE